VHHHHHAHSHAAGRAGNRRRMAVALAINLVLVAVGVAGALLFGSVALLADAGHVLSDVAAIGLGLLAAALAARPARGRRTFGFQRTEILAAFVNGLLLVAVAVLVFVEAIARLSGTPDVKGGGVIVVGVIGLVGNVAATAALAAGDREDLNLEAVLRHSAADALGSIGVVVSGVIVLATGWEYADPIAGLLIGLLILAGSAGLVREAFDVLMEAAPAGLDVEEIGQAMAAVPGVREVHDLHVWTVTSGFPALAAHLRTAHDADVEDVRARVEAVLHDRYDIHHTTLQTMPEKLLKIEDRRG
jgi:cobalt-zinc-cadmium efflux system protein